MRTDFIFDIETIGPNVHACPIVDISYRTFDWERFTENPYSFPELVDSMGYLKLNVKDQVDNYDCSFKTADVDWWMSKPKAVKDKMKPSPNDLLLVDFAETFLTSLESELKGAKKTYWWTRSNTFDPIIVWRLLNRIDRSADFDRLLKFYLVRDIRTYIDAKFDFKTRNGFVPVANESLWYKTFNAHDSTHDVAADILRLQAIYRAEHDLEMVEI